MTYEKINTYGDMHNLSESDLRDYIKNRLNPKSGNLSPSIAITREEEPEDFIINAFKSTNYEVLKKFYSSMASLIDEQLNLAKISASKIEGQYFSHLIYIVEYFGIQKTHNILKNFVYDSIDSIESNGLIEERGYYTDKIYEQILRALASLQKESACHFEIWEKIFNTPQLQEFAQAAFTGLRFCGCGPDNVIKFIPDYAMIAEKKQNGFIIKLGNSLVSLIRQYGNDDIKKIVLKIVDSVVKKKETPGKSERLHVFYALSLSPRIKNDYIGLLIPLLPWGILQEIPKAIKASSTNKNPPHFNFSTLDYAEPDTGKTINNLINTLKNPNHYLDPKASIESINNFLNNLDNIIKKMEESYVSWLSGVHGTLNELSVILSNTKIVEEIKRTNAKKLSKSLLKTKDRCLSMLEKIKGDQLKKTDKIFHRIDKAVLSDMLGFDEAVIKFIDEADAIYKDKDKYGESIKDKFLFKWFRALADFHRLRSKTCLFGDDEKILEGFTKAEDNYYIAFKIDENEKHLFHLRLADVLFLHGKFLFAKNRYEEAGDYADEVIKFCKEFINDDKKRYSMCLKLSDAYFLKAQTCEVIENKHGEYDKHFNSAVEACKSAKKKSHADFVAYKKLAHLYIKKSDALEAVKVLETFRKTQENSNSSDERTKRSNDMIEYEIAELLAENNFPEYSMERLVTMLTDTQQDNTKAAELVKKLINKVDIETACQFAEKFANALETLELNNLSKAQSKVIFSIKSLVPDWGKIEKKITECSKYNEEIFAQYYFDLAMEKKSGSEEQQQLIEKAKKFNNFLENKDADKNDKIVWTRSARIKILQGSIDNAINLLKELNGKFNEDEYIPFHIGECYQRKKDYNTALKYYQDAYSLNPIVDSADRIAFCSFKMGDINQSRSIFKSIVKNNPADATAINALGVISFKEGKRLDAAEYWIKALRIRTNSFNDEGCPTGRHSAQAERTAQALVSLLSKNEQEIKDKIVGLTENENVYLAALIVDQLSDISYFDKEVADKVLDIVGLNRPIHLKRRVAQFCMGRAIFLFLGLITDEKVDDWINRVIAVLSVPDVGKDLVSEFLAGSKSSYERALRKFATARHIQDISGLKQILSDPTPHQDQNNWKKFFDHIKTSVADPSYYKTAKELLPVQDEVGKYALYQIKELSIKIARDIKVDEKLRELVMYLEKEEKDLNNEDYIKKLEKGLELLSPNARKVKNFWRVADIQKKMVNGNNRPVSDDPVPEDKEWDKIKNYGIWADGESLALLGRWCLAVATSSNGNVNSKKTNIEWAWDFADDNSISYILKTDKKINCWPQGIDKWLAANSAAKLEQSDGIGFVHFPTTSISQAEEIKAKEFTIASIH